jgi:YHS domain-containing protein
MQRTLICSIAAAFMGIATLVMAETPKGPTTKPAATQPVAGKPINKYCAVEGKDHEVDPKVFVIYKGKTVGFCCKDCQEEFEKDPEKWMKRLE